jgi:MFS transporter, DHA1 family, staphyloferrin A biosynthesis exporter
VTHPEPTARGGMFRSLASRNFRLLIAGQMATTSAHWMEQVARGWLVYEMTQSPVLLGAVQATRALPLLVFGLLGGVLADRLDRKRQMILSQNANLVLALVLGMLIVTGLVEIWHVFVTAALAGAVQAFQQPARQSMIPDLVDRGDLMNAIAVNSGVLNVTRTVGPAVAGLLVAGVGAGGCYLIQAGLFLFSTIWTAQISLPPPRAERARLSVWSSFGEGIAYVRTNHVVLLLLMLALVPIILAQPYSSLVPVFAKDVWDIGAQGQGLLLSAPGVGAVIGALIVARLSDSRLASVFLLGGVILFGLALVAFAMSPWLPAALAALLLVGIASTAYRAVNQTLLQTNTEDAYRGRVMSVYLLDRGLAPAGSMLAGILAAALGAPEAVMIMGLLTAGFGIAITLFFSRIRSLS